MTATLYFDVGSPFVYLTVERLDRFDFGQVKWRPVSLGALFKATGRSSWALTPRRQAGMAEIEARARAYTDEAATAGVFGVPTLRVGERLFWGDDQLEVAAAVP
jgi:2-hydroxychromene-2-carboxylate isomerase